MCLSVPFSSYQDNVQYGMHFNYSSQFSEFTVILEI